MKSWKIFSDIVNRGRMSSPGDVEEGLWDLKEALMTRDAHTLSETVYFSPAFDAVHREPLRFGDEEGVEVCRNIVERLDVITLNQAFRRLVQKLERFVP